MDEQNVQTTPDTGNGPVASQGTPMDTMTSDQQTKPEPTQVDGDHSQQGPTPSQPQQLQQMQQHGQEDTEQTPGKGQIDQKPQPQVPAQAPPSAHPLVQKASIIHEALQALSGGPRYQTTINPNTGDTVRTQVPVSTKNLGMLVALEALGGAMTGAAQHGPNHVEKAAEAGFQQGQQQSQQMTEADQKQAQQAQQDYARKAAITNTNFQAHQNALRLGQMEYSAHKQYVDDAKPVLDNLNQVGAIKAAGVRENELTSKYNVTKDMAVVDGTVPRMNPDGTQAKNPDGSDAWDNTYSVIDPDAQIAIPDATSKMLADHHVPGYFKMVDGKTVPIELPKSSQLRARMVVDGLATASAIKITEGSINQQLSGLKGGDDESKKFEVKLTQGLEDGTVTPKALKTFARYSGMPLDQAVAQMQKDKVDPDTVGQIASLIPQDAMEQMKQQRADKLAKQKADEQRTNLVVDNDQKATAVMSNPKAYSPEQVAAAKAFINNDSSRKVGLAGAEEQTRLQVKKKFDDANVSDTINQHANEAPVNGVRQGYLNALDPEHRSMIQAIGEGRALLSDYAAGRKEGAKILEQVTAAYPDFDKTKVKMYQETREDFTKGKSSQQVQAANNALQHLGDYFTALKEAEQTGIPLVAADNAIAKRNPAINQMIQARDRALVELEKSYNAGAVTDNAFKHAVTLLHPSTYKEGVNNARSSVNLLMAPYHSWDDRLARSMPSSAVPEMDVMAPEAKEAFKTIMGKDPDTTKSQREHRNRTFVGNSNASQPSAFTPPPGSFQKRDAQGNVTQYKLPNGSIVDAHGNAVQQ